MGQPYSLEDRVRAAEAIGVHPDNRPIYAPARSDRAVLLLHGFRSTPWQMEPLATTFSQHGYAAYAPLLPGHGTRPEDLATKRRVDWEGEALDAYAALQREYANVYTVGLSMGGVLALRVAEQERPKAVVSINAPVWLREREAELAWLFKRIKPEVFRPASDQEHYYERIPLAAVAELVDLINGTYRGLQQVAAPALVVQSTRDVTVFPESGQAIYDRLTGEKELSWRRGAAHVISREPDVVAQVVDYVQKH